MRAILLTLLLTACAPSSQLVVYVDTDAPVPVGPDTASVPWLFNRLRVELSTGGAPATPTSSRDFALDEPAFTDARVSFGVVPPVASEDTMMRVRMFRGDRLVADEPPASITLDSTYQLPALGDTGTRELTVHLHVADVGQSLGPLTPDEGKPTSSEVGTFVGARPTDCAVPPAANEACIPGGAYWMGDPVLAGINEIVDSDQERLVVLSPFHLEKHEVTVADMRGSIDLLHSRPTAWSGSSDPTNAYAFCTYTDGPTADDPNDTHAALPVNCIDWTTAFEYCHVFGKSLPSEAQLEFVASGRGSELAYVWGDDEPSCTDAIWGRGAVGVLGHFTTCLAQSPGAGAAVPGSGARDRVTIEGVELTDLAGNLASWATDKWSRQTEAYWSRVGVFTDPVADLDSVDDGMANPARAGAWYNVPLYLRAAFRQPIPLGLSSPSIGFRCASPGM